jgi:hypothetical protein
VDDVQVLLARADSLADGFMAVALEHVEQAGETAAFDESEIRALREAYKTGWLSGYSLGLEEALHEFRT